MVKESYTVNVLSYKDGTMVATSDDIQGLVMEINSYDELKRELQYLCPSLLMNNHGLTEDELLNIVINVIVRNKETQDNSSPSKPNGPYFYIQENPNPLRAQA